jgi:hypothetical protein
VLVTERRATVATKVVTRAPSNARMSWRHKMKTERRITAEFMERMKTAAIMEPYRTPDLDRQPPVKLADAAEDMADSVDLVA